MNSARKGEPQACGAGLRQPLGGAVERGPIDASTAAALDARLLDARFLEALTAAVARAAAATLGSRSDLNARIKPDGSPVTAADERSQAILLDAMAELLPGVPVVAEEMASLPSQLGNLFVLIDPLDGTKEYVAGRSDYTVNVAIVSSRTPVLGIVAVPAAGVAYRGALGQGAERLAMAPDGTVMPAGDTPVRVRAARRDALLATVSRTHLDPASVGLLDRLGVARRVPCGSALKFCRVAEGAVDLYPRLATTCEWDVAAGHALVEAAGGSVTLPDGGRLDYGGVERGFRVPAFVAWGDRPGVTGEAP